MSCHVQVFIDSHYEIGELYQEFINEGCKKISGAGCDFCTTYSWVGPEIRRIRRPEPDPDNPGHYKNVFKTSGINGEDRPIDDFLPRANLKSYMLI